MSSYLIEKIVYPLKGCDTMENNLSRIRETKNMTQEELDKAIGISRPYLSDIERGKKEPGLDIALKLASTLEVSVENIFYYCSKP